MSERPIKILLIEDNPGDARLIREMLSEMRDTSFDLECTKNLSTGLESLKRGRFDVVFLDLSLPDSHGFETFTTLHTKISQIPIIVLSSLDDEELAIKAVREGAQDYLVKGHVNSELLERSMHYAIERQRMLDELRSLSLVDELTGLYNRRGFFTLAQQQLKTTNRTKRGVLLIFADLDKMKWINDTLGHSEGDRALKDIADILKMTFRASDIIARIGGDEFAVLLIDTPKVNPEVFINRLQQNIKAQNAKLNRPYRLSVSVGISRYDPESPCGIDELLVQADRLMYKQKWNKQKCKVKEKKNER